jgi:hypothetical protein
MPGIPATPPTTPPANNSGLLLTLDSTWADGYGYRPIRITVKPVAATTADRTLEIVLKPGWNYRASDVTVSQVIELPAGFTSVTKTIAVPQLSAMQQQLSMDVYEDGALVRELSIDNQYFGMGGSQFSGDNASPSVLSLSANINDYALFAAINHGSQQALKLGGPQFQSSGTFYTFNSAPQRMAMFSQTGSIASLADLPDRWIDYSGLDVIFATVTELEQLKNQHPEKWQAIRRWVMAGGNLWVYGLDGAVANAAQTPQLNKPGQTSKPKWERLRELNELIDFGDAPPPSQEDKDKLAAGWRDPDPSLANEQAPQIQYWGGPGMSYSSGTIVQPPQSFDSTGQPIVPPARFLLRHLGHGMVAAISDPNPTQSDFHWNWLYSSVGVNRFHWVARNGVSFQTPNDNYWYFLIPGVGAAPVGIFKLLITVFVIAIGPVNYYLLKRWHKQNLILITVPVSAALVTLALVAYAILSDGFGVRMQSRSITYLDQTSGEAACVGRLTYYAGLTPAKGLSFSSSTAVYPLEESPSGGRRDAGPKKSMRWVGTDKEGNPDTQHLESGWLQARVQNQFVTVRARKSDAAIAVNEHGDGTADALNQLGTPIQYLAVRDSNENLRHARNIGLDDSASLDETDPGTVRDTLSEFRQGNVLAPPDDMRKMRSRSIFDIRRTYYYRSYPMGLPGTQFAPRAPGLIEDQIDRALQFGDLNAFGPRTYIAIVDRSPEQEVGLENVDEESGFHVIVGRW